MECLHPHCPMGGGAASWSDVAGDPRIVKRKSDRNAVATELSRIGPLGNTYTTPNLSWTLLRRILWYCPCLYAQIGLRTTARGVVHLCEVTLNARLHSGNVHDAFLVQHPSKGPSFLHKPLAPQYNPGSISEELCSEVLTNEGLPHMPIGSDGWPEWTEVGHVSLNSGKMSRLKTYGDILIPAAPTNLLVSVKTEAARERLMVSGNRFESIGFGFFDNPAEFWSSDKVNLYRRMGFVAIYMPQATVQRIVNHLTANGLSNVNINGTHLFRPLTDFGREMKAVAGRVTLDL